ncbi:MAG: hypothetical protein Ta2G_16620 [Termitinemataceae bacterium]|nr:MAG: hypothetical protein Ta2G_16620 [Termitinemataceae bacterium]
MNLFYFKDGCIVIVFAAVLCLLFSGCKKVSGNEANGVQALAQGGAEVLAQQLSMIAEVERSGGFTPGMGVKESSLLEAEGNMSGAVAAAYKELVWAYSYSDISKKRSDNNVSKKSMKDGILKVIELDKENETQVNAARAMLLFNEEKFEEALIALNSVYENSSSLDEPDSFVQWMILVCKLQSGVESKIDKDLYSMMRSRYASLPAYWFYGTKSYSAGINADYAERCINLNPDGPYAPDSRIILAAYAGLDKNDAPKIMSRKEIEDTIRDSLSAENPSALGTLLPLISLRDNPFTLYATGALRSIAEGGGTAYKNWFSIAAESASGRLQERLRYITGHIKPDTIKK